MGDLSATARRCWRALLLLAVMVGLSACGGDGGRLSSQPGRGETPVGALLALTGPGSGLGIASKSALEIAASDLNADLARQGSDVRMRIVVEDTKHDPAIALQKLQALAAQGVKIVIGPQSSSEVQALKAYADEHGIIIISQGSTSSALSIAGDNIFRVVPDDRLEAEALVALMWADGIRSVVPLWRADLGNQGLHDSVQRTLAARGGTVTAGVRYPTTAQDFTSVLPTIRVQVEQAAAGAGASTVAVYLAAFDEAVTVLDQARNDPVLSSVKWYGSDGAAQITGLPANAAAAAFAVKVGYPCPIYGLEDALASKWQPVADQIRAQTGITPDAFALSAYDALRVAARAYVQTRGVGNVATFKKALLETAESYSGITGSTALNEAGDRKLGSFDFWGVCGAGGAFQWIRLASYRSSSSGTGTLTRLSACAALP